MAKTRQDDRMDAMKARQPVVSLDAALLNRPAAEWSPVLARLLDEQHERCVTLDRLSREQAEHVREGRTDELAGVLSERERVIERIVEINAAMEPFRVQRDSLLGRLDSVRRDVVRRRIEEIANLIEGVRARDEHDRLSLERQRCIVADELAGVARARGAMAAYGGAARAMGAGSTGHSTLGHTEQHG